MPVGGCLALNGVHTQVLQIRMLNKWRWSGCFQELMAVWQRMLGSRQMCADHQSGRAGLLQFCAPKFSGSLGDDELQQNFVCQVVDVRPVQLTNGMQGLALTGYVGRGETGLR